MVGITLVKGRRRKKKEEQEKKKVVLGKSNRPLSFHYILKMR
jgi:hypothetical protein